MASLGIIQATVSSTASTNSTSFVEVVESDALESGKTYYVICQALCKGDDAAQLFEWRLVDRTNSDSVISNSTLIREQNASLEGQSYSYVGKFTAGSDGGGLAFEQRVQDGSYTASTEFLSMLIFDISNLSVNDWFYASDRTPTTLTNSFVDFASFSSTGNLTASDTWLVFGWASFDMNSVSYNTEMRWLYNESGVDITTLGSFEGEDLTETLGFSIARAIGVAGTGVATWKIQARDDSTSGVRNAHAESTVFGLRMNAFENFATNYTADSQTTSTAFVQLATNNLTPDSSGDIVAIGYSGFDAAATNRPGYSRIQVAGATSPNTVPDTSACAASNDGSDIIPTLYITKYDGVEDTEKTVDFDGRKTSPANYGFINSTLAQFSSKIMAVAPIVFSDVASETYNSGDAASESFNSGDVASEVNP
tara:strand:- start:231 stop:1499 length:1269 start_codon:yes stop_codon:yes gene_type:complete